MNIRHLFHTTLFILLSLSGSLPAAEYFAGQGIGYDPWSFPWIGRVVFDKKDVKAGAPETVIKTGEDVTPPSQKNTNAKLIVPKLNYIAWCNSYSNPLVKNNEDFNTCYGNAQYSHWYVLDFNKLYQQGLRAVWVSVAAERYPVAGSNGGLIPALTVFQGRQTVGSTLSWYPQTYQTTPEFWADDLQPFTGGSTRSTGWATALGNGNQDLAEVTGWVKLRPGGQNFLTVAVGGDAHRTEVTETTVNEHSYALALRVGKTKPAPAVLHTAANPERALASGQDAARVQSTGGVTIKITNNTGESIQACFRCNADWTTVEAGTSLSNSYDSDIWANLRFGAGAHTAGFWVYNPWIGYPTAYAMKTDTGNSIDYLTSNVSYSVGESTTGTTDGITWTIKRDSDGDNNQKNFTLTLSK